MKRGGLPPFGFSFEVNSALSPEALKHAVRSKWKPLFDKRSGPRGWIAGPLFCLWLDPYWTMGPNAVGLISRNGTGSKIVGLAGFDLAGTAMLLLISIVIPLVIGLGGNAGLGFSILTLILFPMGGALIMWSRAPFHHEADPIVRFLDTVSRPASRQRRARSPAVPLQRHLTLTIDGEEHRGSASWKEIEAALHGLESDSFLILAEGPETYVQLLRISDEFVVEKREGGGHSHFRGMRTEGRAGHSSAIGPTFSGAEAQAVLAAHASDAPMPAFIAWKKIRM